jgi:hypothetical protein
MNVQVAVDLQLNAFLALKLDEAERLPHAWAALSPRIEDSQVIHLAVCLTTGPKPLPKRNLHMIYNIIY